MAGRLWTRSMLGVLVLALLALPAMSAAASERTAGSTDQGEWLEVVPLGSAPSVFDAATAYDSTTGRVVMFGGDRRDEGSDQTWVFDGTTWTMLELDGRPPRRYLAASAFDEARSEVVMFGGTVGGEPWVYGDTWVFDGVGWSERFPDASPPALQAPKMAYDPARAEIVLFGGADYRGRAQRQTWVWDGATWERRARRESPPARWAHGMAYSEQLGGVVVYGGASRRGPYLGDTWLWNGTTWTELDAPLGPSPRTFFGMTSYGSGVLVFGGWGVASYFNDTWVLDAEGWRQLDGTEVPSARGHVNLAYDSTLGRVVLFGGRTGAVPDPVDTWVFDASCGKPRQVARCDWSARPT